MRQPLFEHRIELAGFETRALELEGDGPPTLLIHGYADSADTWRLTLERLGRVGRRAIAIDLPGFAEADPLREGSMLEQYDAFAGAAVELAAEDGGDVVVVGNSLGGAVALRLRLPRGPAGRRCRAGRAGRARHAALVLDHRARPARARRLGSRVPMPGPVVRRITGEAYRQLAFARPREASEDVVRAFTRHHSSSRHVKAFLDVGRRLLPELTLDAFELDRIDVPVLLVWGDRDRMVSHQGARHVLAQVPGARYVELTGCGHCPQLEQPDEFTDLLLGFAT